MKKKVWLKVALVLLVLGAVLGCFVFVGQGEKKDPGKSAFSEDDFNWELKMQVSFKDMLNNLSGNNTEVYLAAIEAADRDADKNYLDVFFGTLSEYNVLYASIFATYRLKDKIKLSSTNEEVEKVIRAEIDRIMESTCQILRTRLYNYGLPSNVKRMGDSDFLSIKLPKVKDAERVIKLLEMPAGLEFWETYEFVSIRPIFERINEELAKAVTEDSDSNGVTNEDDFNNSLFAKLDVEYEPYYGPIVGTAHYRDTAIVMAMLNSDYAKSLLPRDLKFAWTVHAIDYEDSKYQLIALRSNVGEPSMKGDVITEAHADLDSRYERASVSITMNSEGARRWQLFTRNNIGKAIAIVLDGYVYSFPTVQNEIPGGCSQITGNFTEYEAMDLANALNSGKMPVSARVVSQSVRR